MIFLLCKKLHHGVLFVFGQPYSPYLMHGVPKMPGKIASLLAHSENERCLPRTVYFLRSRPMLFKAMVNKTFELNVNINRNETDKINSISENLTKVKVNFDFDFSGSLTPQDENLGYAFSYIIQKMTLVRVLEQVR